MGSYSDTLRKLQEDYENRTGEKPARNPGSATKRTARYESVLDKLQKDREERKKRKPKMNPPEMTEAKKDTLEEEEDFGILDGWFKKPESDIAKTILGTGSDLLSDLGTGLIGMGEKALDAFAYLAPAADEAQRSQNGLAYQFDISDYRKKQQDSQAFIQKDLYDEAQVAKQILSGLGSGAYLSNIAQGGGLATGKDLILSQEMQKSAQKYLDENMEKDSVLDTKADSLVQSAGQLLGTSALTAMGIPADVVIGLTSFGSEVENAFNQGASYEDAGLSAAVSAGAEILSEKISGGIKFGGKTLDDAATKWLARTVSNKAGRTLAKLGMDMAGEGAEEVLSGAMSAVGQKLTYMDEKELKELFTKEDAWEAFIGGAALGGGGSAVQAVQSQRNGVDAVSGLTKNEQKVIDKVYKDMVEDAKKDGKVTEKEKSRIYDRAIRDMEKGYISTDTIEEIFGGETYNKYKKASEWEDSLRKEYDTLSKEYDELYSMKNSEKSNKQIDREAELKTKLAQMESQLENVKKTSSLGQMKDQLSKEVSDIVKGDRLAESYNEKGRRGQKFEADLSQYDKKYHGAIQRAIDSGVLNNTNRSHELVDLAAKLEADKGMAIDFTNNEKIKNSGFAIAGKTVNGYKTDSGIAINVNSPKYLNTTVGHEITHVLEGTEAYAALSEAIKNYAVSKEGIEGYNARIKAAEELYKDMKNTTPEAEVVSDLVGDYLFTDADFINRLSTENRNVFEKIFDEIKYLCRVVTAGSREARELEKVKKAFEDAYRVETKNTTEDGGVRYALDSFGDQVDSVNAGTFDRSNHVYVAKTPEIYGKLGLNGELPMLTTAHHIKKAQMPKNSKKHQHGLTDTQVKDLPNKVADPVMIMDALDTTRNSIVVVTDMVDPDGMPVIVSIMADGKGQYNNVEICSNFMTSYYGRDKFNNFMNANINANTLLYINGKKATALAAGPNTQWFGQLRNYSFDTIIRQAHVNVNINSDETYKAAVSTGDIATAQKMVDEAARKAGYDIKAYHGTKDSFAVFKGGQDNQYDSGFLGSGFYFTDKRESAEDYSQWKKGDGEKRVMDTALRMTNPLVIEDASKPHLIAVQEALGLHLTDFSNFMARPNKQISDAITAEAKKQGYDGIIRYSEFYDETTYVVFDSSQVKSADPVTYDDNGNVIPLPKRFDMENPDIRYSLANEGEHPQKYGSYNISGEEVAYAEDDIGPVRDNQENLAEIERLREESKQAYNERIESLGSEYDALKDTDPKAAGDILKQITREQNAMRTADAEYAKQINDLTARAQSVQEDIAPTPEGGNAEANQGEEQRTTRKALHTQLVDGIRGKFAEKGFDMDEVLNKAKNLSTFATVDNTPQRVMEKALGYKEGNILADMTVNRVAQNETEGIKWLNSFTDRKNGLLAQLSKRYNIKPGSKESAAAQMYAEGFYVGENNEIIQYGDAELVQDFPDAKVRNNIKGLASDPRIRQVYDDTLNAINESRKRNLYPEIPRLDNYFLHFRAMDDTFSRLGLPFNPNDIRAKDLPTDLNGVTADLKPGQPYFASAMHRKGKRTSFDLLGGMERYLTSAKNQIYHIDDIQTLRALRNYIADTYGQANGLEGLDALSEDEAQQRIEQVYNSHLSTFAKFLNEEANTLAGKTALIDRGLEGILGRRGITFLNTLNGQVGSNMVGYNLSSSLTNFLPVAQTFAKTNKADFVKAFAQTVGNKVGSIFGKSDGFTENSPVAIRRKGADRFYRTAWQKIADPGYALMGAVDDISTELIARTKYNEFTRKGMDPQQAHYETDKWVSRLMGDRSIGQQPQLYNSKMLGLVTKFQLEVRNQLDSQFYDTVQEAKVSNEEIQNNLERNAKTAAKVTSTFVQLAVAQHLFGKAFESVAGYNPAFDMIEVLMTAFGYDDDEESEDTVLDNIEQGFLALLEDLPYASTFTGGGRIPISSALPIGELVKGEDQYGNEKSRWETLGEIAPYYLLPGGYGQIKKTAQGLNMFSDEHPIAGSYTDSGNLRFPVADTLANRIQAGIFGQYASENARDYFDNERKTLKEEQIQELIDVDIPIQDYWAYREGLSKIDTWYGKADYIASLDLPVEKKNILINNLADRDDPIDLTGYEEYPNFEEFDYAQKNPDKYQFLQEHNISAREYKDFDEETKNAYSWAFKNPGAYTVSKAISDDLVTYRKYTGDLNDIRADKDKNGKSINGSAKKKKIDYINGLDLEYGAKMILLKSEYPSDDTYNDKIVEYLNDRDDISFADKKTILAELGAKVGSDGRVSWD